MAGIYLLWNVICLQEEHSDPCLSAYVRSFAKRTKSLPSAKKVIQQLRVKDAEHANRGRYKADVAAPPAAL